MALFSDLMAAIPVYTGLSPVTFFTIGALVVALYYLVTSLFAPPPPPKRDFGPVEPPPPPPIQLGDVTEEELSAYDGRDPSKPLLMAIKGQIYDVSRSRMFYGPGGPYALFAGKDASRALAKMSFEEQDLNGNLEGLGAYEMDALQDWEWKFIGKYEKVGQIVKKVSESREVPVVSKDEEANSRDIDTTVTEAKDIDTTAATEAEDSVKADKESEKQVTSEDAKESKEGNEEKVSEEPEKTIAKEETATTE